MSDKTDSPAFVSALVTEHFVLQSAASATISESSSRAAIYLSSLSSALVAVGFASTSHGALVALACTVLPTVFVLGCFTLVRLVDTTIENNVARKKIEQIRRHYSRFDSLAAEPFFQDSDPAIGTLGVRYSAWSILFTMASMIAIVNSVLGAACVTLILTIAFVVSAPVSLWIGVVAGAASLIVSIGYERRRFIKSAQQWDPNIRASESHHRES